mmetsp:Transcript_131715/g.232910  ORF Transcript_131715/g.232910 Transcript_131715/m.232910 type:complete len:640 (-) Transcript_131715:204-2123(-)
MLHVLASFVGKAFTYAALSSGDSDCTIHLKKRVVPNFSPRIVPITGTDDLTVAWQDSESIYLQRYDGLRCDHIGTPLEVHRSEDFFRDPGDSGLEDGAWLHGKSDSVVVAWTLGGDVWVQVIRMSGFVRFGSAVRANGPQRYTRAEVRVIANPDGDGFVVAWSSWMQDGDGWGVYARPFNLNAEPLESEERQINQHWEHFQWQPQLMWCGRSLWATFSNNSGDDCAAGDRCATGPFVRRIAVRGNDSWQKSVPDEVDMHGNGPLAAALTCQRSSSENVTVFWLEDGGEMVRATILSPDSSLMKRPSFGTDASTSAAASTVTGQHQSLRVGRSSMERLQGATSVVTRRRLLGATEETNSVAAGQVAMIAHRALVVLLTNNGEGNLYAQLLNFGDGDPTPRKQVASGVEFARASWDTAGQRLAIVFCWASGSVLQDDEPNGFTCVRRNAEWLIDLGSLEFGGKLALIIVLSVVLVFCCMRHCSRAGPPGRRRPLTDIGRQGRRTASQARIRELREQLAQIPESPPTLQMPETSASVNNAVGGSPAVQPSDNEPANSEAAQRDAGNSSQEETSRASSAIRWTSSRSGSLDACSICQNDVTMWVALRPCGHTACRGCVLRIVEMNQRCHICRSTIEGVLPVYI